MLMLMLMLMLIKCGRDTRNLEGKALEMGNAAGKRVIVHHQAATVSSSSLEHQLLPLSIILHGFLRIRSAHCRLRIVDGRCFPKKRQSGGVFRFTSRAQLVPHL